MGLEEHLSRVVGEGCRSVGLKKRGSVRGSLGLCTHSLPEDVHTHTSSGVSYEHTLGTRGHAFEDVCILVIVNRCASDSRSEPECVRVWSYDTRAPL